MNTTSWLIICMALASFGINLGVAGYRMGYREGRESGIATGQLDGAVSCTEIMLKRLVRQYRE